MANQTKGNILDKIRKIFAFQDLTSERPFKVILLFALPILLSNLLGSSIGLINSLVLKTTVGTTSVVAMNQTNSINSLLFQLGFGASSGFAIIGSQRYGAKDEEGLKKAFNISIFLCVILAILISTAGFIFLDPLLDFLNVDAAFYDRSKIYLIMLLSGFILTLLNNLVGNYLRALGNSSFPLLVSFGGAVLNILFVYLLTAQNLANLDTLGCGIANILMNLISILCNYLYLVKKHKFLRFSLSSLKGDKKTYLDLLKLGLPLGFQWSILFIGSFVQNSQINIYGPDASSAMTCYSQFESYLTIVFSVLASALLTYVGQNYGAKKYKRVRKGILECSALAFVFYLILLVVGFSSAKYVPYIFLNAEDVNDKIVYYTSSYLYVLTPSLILQGILMISRSSLQGINKPLIPFISGVGELAARILVSLFVPYLIDNNYQVTHSNASFLGLCFSNTSAWLVSFLLMGTATIVTIILNKKFKYDEVVDINNCQEKKEENI